MVHYYKEEPPNEPDPNCECQGKIVTQTKETINGHKVIITTTHWICPDRPPETTKAASFYAEPQYFAVFGISSDDNFNLLEKAFDTIMYSFKTK